MLLDRESSSLHPRPVTDRERPGIDLSSSDARASNAVSSAAVVHNRQRSLDLLLDGRGGQLNGDQKRPPLLLPRPASTPRSLAASPADRSTTPPAYGSEWTQQLNSYASWVNAQLQRRWPGRVEVKDLRRELRDGTVLVDLLHALSGEPVAVPHAAPATAHDMCNNVECVLQFMRAHNIKMQPIAADEVVAGNTRTVMRLILSLAAHFKPGSARQAWATGQPPQTAQGPQLQQLQLQQSCRPDTGTVNAATGSASSRQSSSLNVAREMVAALARIRQDMAKIGRPAEVLHQQSLSGTAAAGAPVHGLSWLQPRPAPRGRATPPSPPIACLPHFVGAAVAAGGTEYRRSRRAPAAFVDCDDMSVHSGGEGSTTSGGGGSCGVLSGQSSLDDSQSEGSDEPAAPSASAALVAKAAEKVTDRRDDLLWEQLRDTLAPKDGSVSAADEVAAARKALLSLQRLLLDDCQQQQPVQQQREQTAAVATAGSSSAAAACQSDSVQVTLLSSRLQQATAMCVDLREQLSLSKQECMQLHSAHANLLRRLSELEKKQETAAAVATPAAATRPAFGQPLSPRDDPAAVRGTAAVAGVVASASAASAAAELQRCRCGSSSVAAEAAAAAARETDALRQLAEAKERLANRDQLIALLRSEVQRRSEAKEGLAANGSRLRSSVAGDERGEATRLGAADELESDLDESAYEYDDADEIGSESSGTADDDYEDEEAGGSSLRQHPAVLLPLPPPPQKPSLLVDGRHGGEPMASELRAIRRTLLLIRKDYDNDEQGQQMVDSLEQSIAGVLQRSATTALSAASTGQGSIASSTPVDGLASDGNSCGDVEPRTIGLSSTEWRLTSLLLKNSPPE